MKKALQKGTLVSRKEMKLIRGGFAQPEGCVGAGPTTHSFQCPNNGPTVCCSGVLGPVYGAGSEGGPGISCLQPVSFVLGVSVYVGISCPGQAQSTLEQ